MRPTRVTTDKVGAYFVAGQEARLPNLEGVLNFLFAEPSVDI